MQTKQADNDNGNEVLDEVRQHRRKRKQMPWATPEQKAERKRRREELEKAGVLKPRRKDWPGTKNLKPFKKGYDPRRNLKGTPKTSAEARELIRMIGDEEIRTKLKNGDVEITSRFEQMIRGMYASKFPRDKEVLIRIVAPGAIGDGIGGDGGKRSGGVKLNVVFVDKLISSDGNQQTASHQLADPDENVIDVEERPLVDTDVRGDESQ